MPISCPHCQSLMDDGGVAGQVIACPHCKDFFEVPGEPPALPSEGDPLFAPPISPTVQQANPYASSISSRRAAFSKKQGDRSLGQKIVMASIVGSLCGIALAVPLGIVASQYFPFFGGWLIEIAEPFSPARQQSLPEHAIVFGICGALLGALCGAAFRYIGEPPRRKP